MTEYGRRLLAACRSCESGDHSGHVERFTIASVFDCLCDCLGDCAARAAAFAESPVPTPTEKQDDDE